MASVKRPLIHKTTNIYVWTKNGIATADGPVEMVLGLLDNKLDNKPVLISHLVALSRLPNYFMSGLERHASASRPQALVGCGWGFLLLS